MAIAALAVAAALAGAACAGSDDDAAQDATAATEMAGGAAAPEVTAAAADTVAGEMGDMVAGSADDAGLEEGPAGDATGLPTVPVADGSAIAIQARATVAVDDVRAAVDQVTTAVTTSGGRISVADVDYDVAERPETDPPAPEQSRAMLVAEVPPAELAGVLDALERIGTVSAYEQLAEDVSEQLTDLDTRIANERASIERVRALIDSAASLQDLVFLESELTMRETTLETLLATQRGLEDRVAMSTLTIDITPAMTAPFVAADATVETPRPGVLDALADGWSVFGGAVFSIVLVLAVALPFLLAALAALVAVLWARRLLSRRGVADRPTQSEPPLPAPADTPAPPAAVVAGLNEPAGDRASRQG